MFGEKPTKKEMDGSSGIAGIIGGAILFLLGFPFSEWVQNHSLSSAFGGLLIMVTAIATIFGGPVLFFWGIWKVRDAKSNRDTYRSICETEKRIKKLEEEEKEADAKKKLDNQNNLPFKHNDDCKNNTYVKVYHLTSLDNLESICRNGVFSRAIVESKNIYTDIASHGALNNHRKLMIGGIPLDNYARCFFNPTPPMFYNRRNEGYDNLCVIELHIPVEKVTKTYSGNTKIFHNLKIEGARYPRMYKQSIASHMTSINNLEVHNLNNIKWPVDRASFEKNRNNTIACRGAELLVYPEIPAKYITKIYSAQHEPFSKLDRGFNLGHPEIVGEQSW